MGLLILLSLPAISALFCMVAAITIKHCTCGCKAALAESFHFPRRLIACTARKRPEPQVDPKHLSAASHAGLNNMRSHQRLQNQWL